ncbi:MAG: long-chain acyl-CoA synthetase [Thermoleophilaceae bacterium]|jgi:acyl-CoA synthetase (AMP-forming)/AMP-acid ligase II|nr:long-chain acyl-CoA synthetase [Thermoleophilaceae bacterium]
MPEPAPRGRNPFDTSGVARGPDGVARYASRPDSLVHMLRATVERMGDGLAVAEIGGARVTYCELWDRAARVAGGLRDEGIDRGDRVAIRLPNGLDWVLAFWGAQLAGAVVVPVNTRFKDSEAQYVIDDSGASYVFGPLPDGEPVVVEDLGPHDLAAIFYTSGTTGFPKGAMTTHANFLANSENAIRSVGIDRDAGNASATIVNVPLFHVTGCNSQLIVTHELGGRVYVLANPLDLEGFLRTAREERVDTLTSVPAIYHALTRHPAFADADLGAVKYVSYGGAPIAASAVEHIIKAFPHARVGNGFGLTETSSLTSYLPHEEATQHADSVGFAMPVCDLAIDEPDSDTGVGELLVRGPNVVQGYWNKPEATAETFVDGWLHTGDLGRVGEDGLLYIVDRKKDMINRGGENVYSIEVEGALAGAPGVGEAAAVGVPDDMMGEKVGAVIVPAGEDAVDVEAVLAHVRERLADFKVPQYVALRSEPLPRNPGGKVLKAQLRDETDWGDPLR